jgi:hypothetical protein
MVSSIKKSGLLFLSLALLFSCSKIAPTNNTITCQFTYSVPQPLKKDQQVRYTAGIAGTGGSFSSITYTDSAGATTVQNPAPPFIVYANIKKGVSPTISAQGTANLGGELLIYILADSVQGGNACNN